MRSITGTAAATRCALKNPVTTRRSPEWLRVPLFASAGGSVKLTRASPQHGDGQRAHGVLGIAREEPLRVEQDPAYVLVAADQPQPGSRVMVNGRLGP